MISAIALTRRGENPPPNTPTTGRVYPAVDAACFRLSSAFTATVPISFPDSRGGINAYQLYWQNFTQFYRQRRFAGRPAPSKNIALGRLALYLHPCFGAFIASVNQQVVTGHPAALLPAADAAAQHPPAAIWPAPCRHCGCSLARPTRYPLLQY